MMDSALVQRLILAWLVIMMMACNLVWVQNDGELPLSELNVVDTTGWVAFPGRGLSLGAPSANWFEVSPNSTTAQQRYLALQEQDPAIAALYLDLAGLLNNDFYRLALMRNDGTAWVTVTTRSLRPGQTFDDALEEVRSDFEEQRIIPRNQRLVRMSSGDAVRWTIDVSPPNSQLINRQMLYFIVVDNQFYTFTFNAQLSDFDTYAPVFETMMLTWSVG